MWKNGVDLILKELEAVLALQGDRPAEFTLQLFNGIGTQKLPTVSLAVPGQETLMSTAQNVGGGIAEILIRLCREANRGYDFACTANAIGALDVLMRELAKLGAAMSSPRKKAKAGRSDGPFFAVEICSAGSRSRTRAAFFRIDERFNNVATPETAAVFRSEEKETPVAALEALIAQAREHLETNRQPSFWQRLLRRLS
jgi:hypothetical protein